MLNSIDNTIKLKFLQRHARIWMTLSLMFSDLLGLTLTFLGIRWGLGFFYNILFEFNTQLWIVLPIFLLIFAWQGLYPGVGLNPVDELRIQVLTVSVFSIGGYIVVLTSSAYQPFLLGIIFWAGFVGLFFLIFFRSGVKVLMRSFQLWGEPVVVIGGGENGQHVYTYLQNSRRLGVLPVLLLDGKRLEREKIKALTQAGIHTAILSVSEISDPFIDALFTKQDLGFKRLILTSSWGWAGSLGVKTMDLEGILGLELRHNLSNRLLRFLKRLLDVILVGVGSIFVLPVILIVALLIRLDSSGPVIYKQVRVGRWGKHFHLWKFRTMEVNADEILSEYLELHPEMKAEWDAKQKLSSDPRITRVGAFLRKFSLDELPQLMNVLRGDMSLVGPRPYMCDQEEIYGKTSDLYKKVSPGITGMWQVSGRNKTTFLERVRMDEYYIRNWSIWIDIYILIRTIWVVLSRHGAY